MDCGICIDSCAEGALQLVDGKAKLVKDIYCDGLGACLKDCPLGALEVIEREADEFDEAAVEKHLAKSQKTSIPVMPQAAPTPPTGGGCPGSAMRQFDNPTRTAALPGNLESQLNHWPVQLMLVPPGAPFLNGANILVLLDEVEVMNDFISDFSFRGGYIGFTGSTGYYTNYHRFDNLQILDDCIVPE